MTNAWFGGFQALVREMREDRYNFFLDEMVKQRNRMTVRDLVNRGTNPLLLDHHWLLQDS